VKTTVARIVIGAAITLTALAPAAALAGGWRAYHSAALGVSFRYPTAWRLTVATTGGVHELTLFSAATRDSLVVRALPIKPASSPSGTLKRYLTYTLQLDGPAAKHYHWADTRLAGRRAEGAVAHPPTEGGVSQAVGVYVVGVGKHVVDLTMRTQTKHSPRTLAQFPAVYRQIVASWRFK
jgi:hypothetical protein